MVLDFRCLHHSVYFQKTPFLEKSFAKTALTALRNRPSPGVKNCSLPSLEKEKLIYTSNTDALTRCLNRHAYENDMKKLNLSEEWVYISADLNGLKQANDSYGHMAGDELICAAADCMRDSFHEYGKVYRIGGDEFAVIITENTSQVEELIHGFDSNVANWHGKFVDSMTVSYGWVFSTERNWGSAYEISKAADARMYQSKERYYKESGADRR